MQLLRLEVRNWVHHRYRVCEFTRGLVAILGENGSGKSSLFGAIRWLLTGDNPNYGVKTDNISQYAKPGEPSYASLEFEHAGHIAVVTRHLLPEKEQSTFTVDGVETARGDKAVTAAVEKLLGVDAKFISRFIIVGQTEIFSFIDESQTETDKFFQRLFNTSKADKCQDLLGKNMAKISIPELAVTSAEVDKQRKELSEELQTLAAQLDKLPSVEDFFRKQSEDQAIVKAWESRNRAAEEVAKLNEQIKQVEGQHAAAKKDLEGYDADLQALHAASQGQEAAISAARTALGHWQSYKAVANAKQKFQATREAIAAARAKDLEPEKPGALSSLELYQDLTARKERVRELKEFVRMFDEHGVAECPTCHTPSSQLANQVTAHKAELETLATTTDELSHALAKQRMVEQKWGEWSAREKERVEAEQRATAAEQELLAVTPPALSEDELAQTVSDYDSFQKARADIAPWAEAAKILLAKLDGNLSSLNTRRAALLEEISDATVTASDAHLANSRLETLRKKLADRTQLEQAHTKAKWSLTAKEEEFARVVAEERKAVNLRRWTAVAEKTRDALKNAPRVVAQRNLQRLEASVNELLQIFRVNFQVKVAEDGSPTFVAEFYDGRCQVAQRLSIGQKTVLAIAFRVAVNAMFAEEIGLLALDEPTAALDQPRIQALAPVLEKLRELSTAKGLQCLLVTHAASLSNLFESAIELEPPELRHATAG